MDDNEYLADRFEAHRTHLKAVAYRMLGSLSEAEDAVQEAWLRLSRSDTRDIANLGGWLTTVVGRVCLDMLRSRTSRREDPLAAHLPDPLVSPADGSDPSSERVRAPRPPAGVHLRHHSGCDAHLAIGDRELEADRPPRRGVLVSGMREHDPLAVPQRLSRYILPTVAVTQRWHRSLPCRAALYPLGVTGRPGTARGRIRLELCPGRPWTRLSCSRRIHAFDRCAGSLVPQVVHYRITSDLIIAGRCWSLSRATTAR
jgi:hypothetical protein